MLNVRRGERRLSYPGAGAGARALAERSAASVAARDAALATARGFVASAGARAVGARSAAAARARVLIARSSAFAVAGVRPGGAIIFSLDDDYDYDYDEADLPPPSPLPPFGLLPVAAAPTLSSSRVDTLRVVLLPPRCRVGRTSREPFSDAARLSSSEDPARRGPSRGGRAASGVRRERKTLSRIKLGARWPEMAGGAAAVGLPVA